MIRFLPFFFFITFLIGLSSSLIFAGEDEYAYRYLKAPHLKWEDERLTGEIKGAPVKGLLEELSLEGGFQLEIFGDLTEKTDLSFDHQTLEESIKRIMRAAGLSYVMITDREEESGKGVSHSISKLIICGKGKSTRSRPQRGKVRNKPPPDRKEKAVPSPPEPSTEYRKPGKAATRDIEVEFEGMADDLKEYLEEISREGKITPEEYEMIMRRMGE